MSLYVECSWSSRQDGAVPQRRKSATYFVFDHFDHLNSFDAITLALLLQLERREVPPRCTFPGQAKILQEAQQRLEPLSF